MALIDFVICPAQGIPTTSAFFTPALGFASNLSHTIIRETQEDDVRSIGSDGSADTSVSISDEELALLGAPWAKEGMLCRKQYWESAGKRAKSKTWQDVFVVIQKGNLDMFIFGERGAGGAENVGGGNWLVSCISSGFGALTLILTFVGQRSDCRQRGPSPLPRTCSSATRLQPTATSLFRPDSGLRGCLFFSSRNRRLTQRVGVDMQLLGGTAKQRTTVRGRLEHGIWMESCP